MFDLGTFLLKMVTKHPYSELDLYKTAPGLGWWENLEVLENSSKLVLEALNRLLEALKEETHLTLARH